MSSEHPTKRLTSRIRRHVNHHSGTDDKLNMADIYQALARAAGYANDHEWVRRNERTMPHEWNGTAFVGYLTMRGYMAATIDAALTVLTEYKTRPENDQ